MSRRNARILVVDDEVNIREALGALLEDDGYRVSTAASVEEAFRMLRKNAFHLVISDLRMNGESGMDILRCMHETCPETEMIFLTAYGTVEGAVEAMKLGAYDYIAKPVDRQRLTLLIEKALDKYRLSMENRNLRRRLSIKEEYSKIIGNSPLIRSVFKIMAEVAPTNATVLIMGESGTGKELVARSIHDRSSRRDRAFVTLNCGALPDSLIESELFGYEAGAFTGAGASKAGRIEMASGGTLFLDEVGDMSLKTQVDLLRVLQDRELRRLGGNRTFKVDVRFIAATNKDLEEEIAEKRFREDFYYRLNVVPIAMPSLRERREDIPLFLESFLLEFCQVHGKKVKTISERAQRLLTQYGWPGNIRELRNTIERMVLLTRGEIIDAGDLPDQISESENRQAEITLRLDQSLENIEKCVIRNVLTQITQNRTQAARILGISLRALHYKIKRYGIDF
ncbi:MAG: sigma-54-dependent Fis family transcriptional regulator [Acidobacteria bacterium]|nr:sigma-54-dependent Fis family transcriptional regulator [Acidobacteriota bacterium]